MVASVPFLQKIAQSAFSSGPTNAQPGLFYVGAIMAGGKTVEQGETALLAQVARLRDAPPSEAELAEAARLEAERQEAAKLAAAQQEAARLEAARIESARRAAAQQEAARLEAERQAKAGSKVDSDALLAGLGG